MQYFIERNPLSLSPSQGGQRSGSAEPLSTGAGSDPVFLSMTVQYNIQYAAKSRDLNRGPRAKGWSLNSLHHSDAFSATLT